MIMSLLGRNSLKPSRRGQGEAAMKKVVIVNAGDRGDLSVKKGSYDNFCARLKAMFERVHPRGKPDERVAEVSIVDHEVGAMPMSPGDVLIFVSLSMLTEAREIKKRNPWMKVVVLTGLLPDDEVVVVDKDWLDQHLCDTLVESAGEIVE